MTFRNSSKIKIRVADEDRPDSLFMDQIAFQRFEKLNRRVTILTVLIPVLICIVIFLGYRDVLEMVSQTQDMGAKELTSLAQNLESTISNLSVKQAKLEEILTGKLSDLEKTEAGVHDSLKLMEKTVQEYIKKTEAAFQEGIQKTDTALAEIKASKADKKEIAGDVSGMDHKLAALQKDMKAGLEKMNADIKLIDKKFSDEFAKSSETVNNVTTNVAECQADISLISNEKADKKAIEVALKNQEKYLHDQTNQLLRSLENKIEAINASILALDKIKSVMEKNPLPPAAKKP